MQISKYLTLEEATHSNTFPHIYNIPTDDILVNMEFVAQNIYDPLKIKFPSLKINSFYRSADLNRALGGARSSQHLYGKSMDLDTNNSNKQVFEYIKNNFQFDQLIWEYGDNNSPQWVHVSLNKNGKNRHEVLRATKNALNKTKYTPFDTAYSTNAVTTQPLTFKPMGSANTNRNVFTPPTGSGISPNNTSVDKGAIYRIERLWSHSIELDELSIPTSTSTTNKNNDVSPTPKPEDVASLEYPLVKINDYIFNQAEIQSMVIECTDFLPKITLDVALISSLFIAKEMPKDGDIISVGIRQKSDLLKIVRADFVITSVYSRENPTISQKIPTFMTFYGELFVPGLKSQVGDMSFLSTSMDALKEFAKTLNLGFATNENNTDDKQIWLKANITGDLFILQTTERAYKDEKSFYKAWIDIYYNLNFVNINLQLVSSEVEVDIIAATTNVDKNTFYGVDTTDENTKASLKVFSNFQTYKATPFYIQTWRPTNKSSSITFSLGTKMTCEMFEHNVNLYENSESQKYWTIPVEPIYDEDKSKKSILLRGRATQNYDPNGKQLKRANHPYVGLYEKFPWLGVQYTISNTELDPMLWDGNHHRNYQLSKVQNIINLKELDKLNLLITTKGNNANIIRGDKLPVILVRSDEVDNTLIREEATNREILDLFYSGWYIIKGYTLTWSSSKPNSTASGFSQEFILTRREWPAPIPIGKIDHDSSIS